MLINPILDKLRALGLEGMLKALEEQLSTPEVQELASGKDWVCWWPGGPPTEKIAGSKTDWPRPSSDITPAWKTSTTGKSPAWASHAS
ncbi:hypothetical protein DFAR_4060009 [Desulfarculales bacterium]